MIRVVFGVYMPDRWYNDDKNRWKRKWRGGGRTSGLCVCVPEEWEMSDANFIIGFCCLQSYLAIRIALFWNNATQILIIYILCVGFHWLNILSLAHVEHGKGVYIMYIELGTKRIRFGLRIFFHWLFVVVDVAVVVVVWILLANFSSFNSIA